MEEPSPKRVKVELDPLSAFLQKIRGFIHPAPILAVGGTLRCVAAIFAVFRLPMNGPPPLVESGASDHLLEKKWRESAEYDEKKPVPGLDNAMVQNWPDNPYYVDFLLSHPEILAIFKAIFGDDFRLVVERFCQQTKPKENMKTFMNTGHVDFPAWKKCPDQTPQITRIPLYPGTITVIIIDQAQPHGIPTSGDSKGAFVGAITPEQHTQYGEATLARLRRPLPLRPQYWPPLRNLNSLDEITAVILLLGIRPVVFPSLKPIAMPAPYNASRYRYFGGYEPPVQSKYAAADVLARIQRKHGDHVAKPFISVAEKLKLEMCAKDPSALSVPVLRRFFAVSGPQ